MMTRRLLAVLASLAFTTGLLAGAATPAHAADAGTVTVSYNPNAMAYSVTPTSLAAVAGDTFTLANTLRSGDGSQLYFVSLQNGTGSVTLSQEPCTSSTACPVLDLFNGTATGTFTVVSPGTVTVWRNYRGDETNLGTLTIGSGSSSSPGPTDPALVYPTATLDPNGGTCTGTLQFTKYAGQNETIMLPTSDTCTRPDYRLYEWNINATGSTGPGQAFFPGRPVPIGDESFTLYAQWVPQGAELTYDANVADADECLAAGTNTMTRTSVVVVTHPNSLYLQPSDGSLAATAPCTPPGMALAGWRLAADGPTGKVFPAGTPVTDLFPGRQVGSNRTRLAAAWQVTYAVTASPTSVTLEAGGNTGFSITALRNGAPAPGASVTLSVPVSAAQSIGLGPTGAGKATVITDASGMASIMVIARSGGAGGTITIAYGDATTSVPVTVQASEERSITIVDGYRDGQRIEVAGTTTGFAPGTQLSPWIRFPGQTGFSQGTAIITVGDDGTFTWGRKTGKRTAVQIRDADGSLRSNTVVIEAR